MKPISTVVFLVVSLGALGALALCIGSSAEVLCGAQTAFTSCFTARLNDDGDRVQVIRTFSSDYESPRPDDVLARSRFDLVAYNDVSEANEILTSQEEFFVCGTNRERRYPQVPVPFDSSEFRAQYVAVLRDGNLVEVYDQPNVVDGVLASALTEEEYATCIAMVDPRELPLQGCPDTQGFFEPPGCSSALNPALPGFLVFSLLLFTGGRRIGKRRKQPANWSGSTAA